MNDLILQAMLVYALYLIFIGGLIIPFTFIVLIFAIYLIKFIHIKNSSDNIQNLFEERKLLLDTLEHDLKIPTLAQLRGVELLQNECLGSLNNEQKQVTQEITNSCLNVLDMISMSVNAYNFNNKTYKLVYEKFNLSEIISSCLEELVIKFNEKHINLFYTPYSEDLQLEADREEIRKVIINLLINAINYSNIGGEINVKTFSDRNKIIMSISGMEFSVNTKYSNIGQDLGMYLSKKIIESHRGKIVYTDVNNTLKSFSFTLPKRAKNMCS